MNTLLPKRSSTELATAAALMLLMLVLPHRTQAAGTVSLNLVERSGVPRTGESLTAGVPIPRGMLQDVTNVRLLLNGKEVPAQFRALGHWWPDSSVRWLLVDTQVSIPAKGSAAYELQFGEEVACAGRPPQPIVVQTHDDRYVINTGPVTFVLNRKQFTLFEEVRIRSQVLVPSPSNQRPAAALRGLRAMVTRPIPHLKNTGHSHLIYVSPSQDVTDEEYELKFLTDVNYELIGKRSGPLGRGEFRKDFTSTNNKILIPRDAWLAYAQPRQGDIYTFRSIPAGASFEAEGVLESSVVESGPLRTVIRIKGCFGPIATPVMEFTAWYHFHAGSGRVKLVFTLENNNHGGRTDTGNANNANIGGINCVFFDSMSLVLPLAAVGDKSFTIGTNEGQPVEWKSGQHLELYQDSSGGPYWNRYKDPKYHPRPNSYVSFKGWKIFADDREVQCGDRATGWLSFSGNGCGLTVAIRDFWQNFPKSLGVHGNGVIEIGLFPGRYAGDFAFRSGEHKTHEILFCFHDIPPTPKESAALAVAFSDPLRLEPPALWFATTRVFGDFHPFDMDNYRDYEIRNLSTIGIFPEGVKIGPSLLSRIEEHNFYGWMDFGDVPIDFEVPSGQWGMKYDFDHQMAMQYARTQRPEWWQLFVAAAKHTADIDIHHQPHYPGIHFVKGGSWAHSLHDEPGHKNPHRNYNHFTKDLCFGARGTAALYYLTGDWKAREACLEIAENAFAQYMSPQEEPDPGQNNCMGVRGDACTLNRLLEGYLMTGQERFLERARWQIKTCAFDGRPANHKPVSLWSSVFYMKALARYVEMFPDDGDAKRWLLAHLQTLRKSVDPQDGIFYTITPQSDGSVTGSGTCSHYNIMAADALTIGWKLTGDPTYMEAARQCFSYGVRNACWKDGPPTYFHVHSANGATHGAIFMATDLALRQRQGAR